MRNKRKTCPRAGSTSRSRLTGEHVVYMEYLLENPDFPFIIVRPLAPTEILFYADDKCLHFEVADVESVSPWPARAKAKATSW